MGMRSFNALRATAFRWSGMSRNGMLTSIARTGRGGVLKTRTLQPLLLNSSRWFCQAAAPRANAARLAQDKERMESTKGMSPRGAYEKLVENGAITRDEHQFGVVQHLERLYDELKSYKPRAGTYEPSAFVQAV